MCRSETTADSLLRSFRRKCTHAVTGESRLYAKRLHTTLANATAAPDSARHKRGTYPAVSLRTESPCKSAEPGPSAAPLSGWPRCLHSFDPLPSSIIIFRNVHVFLSTLSPPPALLTLDVRGHHRCISGIHLRQVETHLSIHSQPPLQSIRWLHVHLHRPVRRVLWVQADLALTTPSLVVATARPGVIQRMTRGSLRPVVVFSACISHSHATTDTD
jgi:hypothetical protein